MTFTPYTLLHIPDKSVEDLQTLVLRSTSWPNHGIYQSPSSITDYNVFHGEHWEFIHWVIDNAHGPTLICDGDMWFFPGCDKLDWLPEAPNALLYAPMQPEHWVPQMNVWWPQRPHTCFWFIPDPKCLRQRIADVHDIHDHLYTVMNLLRPYTYFEPGVPPRWADTGTQLGAVINWHSLDRCENYFFHVRSSSVPKIREKLMTPTEVEAYRAAIHLVRTDPNKLKGIIPAYF